jgi:pyridoxamine 5'-phosphate oxidase
MSYPVAPADPIATFCSWYDQAVRAGLPFPDAMTLATVGEGGRPAARVVLYKGLVDGKVSFVTNFKSRKARELEQHAAAALVFFWPGLGRRMRFEGLVAQASDELSDRYFAARDRDSQLGAWASDQSAPIDSREALEASMAEVRQRYDGQPVPRPAHWGMYLLAPDTVELWISGEHRLHDRFLYRLAGAGWQSERLAP